MGTAIKVATVSLIGEVALLFARSRKSRFAVMSWVSRHAPELR